MKTDGQAGVDGQSGIADDVKFSGGGCPKDVATVVSRITGIVIGGQVNGTPAGGDHFGVVADNIGSFKARKRRRSSGPGRTAPMGALE